MTSDVNRAQADWWNAAGQGWANAQEIVDLVLRPYQDLIVETATEHPRHHVLDVGCGTGAVTRALIDATGARCLGVDIAESMLTAAKAHDTGEFVLADAQTHEFDQSFDLIVSRFGVMFFDDPAAAFRNLRHAATGDLCFVTWRAADENPFMSTASRAAAPYFPDAPPPDPDGPGPHAFADPDKTRNILKTAGWTDVELDPVDRVCTMPESLLTPYLSNLGPIARALRESKTPDRILEEVRGEFDEFVHNDEVRIPGAVWRVTASAPL
ncbi:class I SAM-dependent methyltransferase [Lentzea sp. JNUCC 0626]|uniref:class I SAM-dependent methyltransferase n=1 Tax=Lentzea sp. JNUCC 0626 TaxID=3367513 RepID=UPI003748DA01